MFVIEFVQPTSSVVNFIQATPKLHNIDIIGSIAYNFCALYLFPGIDYKNKVITLEEENIKLQIWYYCAKYCTNQNDYYGSCVRSLCLIM